MCDDADDFGSGLDEEEAAIVAAFTPAQVDAIDDALLSDITPTWSKVAMILGKQLKAKPGIPDDVPLEYYWERICRMIERGDLDSQGNIRRIRFSEVRRR